MAFPAQVLHNSFGGEYQKCAKNKVYSVNFYQKVALL
jgi:hypothetical protein